MEGEWGKMYSSIKNNKKIKKHEGVDAQKYYATQVNLKLIILLCQLPQCWDNNYATIISRS